jgi:hypothetical protein
VDRAGSKVKFINYNSYIGYFGGRFCETGVDESTSESNTRRAPLLVSRTNILVNSAANTGDRVGLMF